MTLTELFLVLLLGLSLTASICFIAYYLLHAIILYHQSEQNFMVNHDWVNI